MTVETDHLPSSRSSDKASTMSSSSDRDIDKPFDQSTSLGEKSDPEQQHPSPVASNPSAPATRPNANDIASIPNGGLAAWLQVLGGFMLFFNTWGILNAFGVYQTYYESGQLFKESSSNISWIGAIQAYLVLLGGLFSGPIYDRGYLKTLVCVGSFGIVFGHMMLSLCHTYWQVILAQGFCVGLGAGCLFVPAVAILPTYFTSRIGIAVGIAAAGSSTGGIIYPIVFYRLISQIGFAWSVRVLGFIALATLLIPIFCMKMRVVPARARAMFDWSAFVDLPYMLFIVGSMIGFMGLYVFFFYNSYFAFQTRITDESLAFYLVPILNAASVFGRTIPNAISDIIGPFNLIIPGALVVGISILCMLAVNSVAGIIVNVIFFGFFSGVFIALPPVCFMVLTEDKTKIGTRMGMGFAMVGLGVLAGGPGGGHILGSNMSNLNWTGLWTFGGVTATVAGLIFIVVRFVKVGWKLKAKI